MFIRFGMVKRVLVEWEGYGRDVRGMWEGCGRDTPLEGDKIIILGGDTILYAHGRYNGYLQVKRQRRVEYNTQREQLKISDYGRHVAKMVDYCKTIEDRAERTAMASTIVDVMAHVNPKIKERTDYKHILWDHMMMLAGYELDVDCPYEIHREEVENMHPKHLGYTEGTIRYRHYGRALEDMVKAVAEMPAGEERDVLTAQIAQAMKRQYLQWNRNTVDDALIVEQLGELSGGRLTLPEGFQFAASQELLNAMETAAKKDANEGKRKKKKKKK